MAKQYLTFALLCLAVHSAAQRRTGLEPGEQVYGNAACITWTDSVAMTGDTIVIEEFFPPDTTYTTRVVDERGNQVLCTYKLYNGYPVMQITNQYDRRNNRTETVSRNGNGDLLWKRVYKYDAEGCPATTIKYNSSDSVTGILDLKVKYRLGKYMHCFDKEGNPTKTVTYTQDDKPDDRPGCTPYIKHEVCKSCLIDTAITYDSGGRKTMTTSVKVSAGTLRTTHLYDIKGNEIETDSYNTAGEKTGWTLMEYDSKGNLLVRSVKPQSGYFPAFKEEYYYDLSGHKAECTDYRLNDGSGTDSGYVLDGHILYDSKGNEIEITDYNEGKMSSKINKAYDEKGNLLHIVTCNKDSSIIEETFYRYEGFDAHGNWHKQITWKWKGDEPSDNLPVIVCRDIQYYE